MKQRFIHPDFTKFNTELGGEGLSNVFTLMNVFKIIVEKSW